MTSDELRDLERASIELQRRLLFLSGGIGVSLRLIMDDAEVSQSGKGIMVDTLLDMLRKLRDFLRTDGKLIQEHSRKFTPLQNRDIALGERRFASAHDAGISLLHCFYAGIQRGGAHDTKGVFLGEMSAELISTCRAVWDDQIGSLTGEYGQTDVSTLSVMIERECCALLASCHPSTEPTNEPAQQMIETPHPVDKALGPVLADMKLYGQDDRYITRQGVADLIGRKKSGLSSYWKEWPEADYDGPGNIGDKWLLSTLWPKLKEQFLPELNLLKSVSKK